MCSRSAKVLAQLSLAMGMWACATQPVVEGPAPQQGESVQHWIAEVPGTFDHAVYLRNDSDSTIIVTGLSVTRCENTRQACADYPMNVGVAPGKTVVVIRFRVIDEDRAWAFAYQVRWRARR